MEVHFLLDAILELALNMDTKYKIKTVKTKQAMISLHRMAEKGLFRELCFFLVFSFQILLDDPPIVLKSLIG